MQFMNRAASLSHRTSSAVGRVRVALTMLCTALMQSLGHPVLSSQASLCSAGLGRELVQIPMAPEAGCAQHWHLKSAPLEGSGHLCSVHSGFSRYRYSFYNNQVTPLLHRVN